MISCVEINKFRKNNESPRHWILEKSGATENCSTATWKHSHCNQWFVESRYYLWRYKYTRS